MSEHDSNAILAEFLRRIDAGEDVNVDAICEAHPEIADDLRSYVEGDGLIADMAANRNPANQRSANQRPGDTSHAGTFDETVRPRGQAAPGVDLSGQSFGRYHITRQLGQGAMGAVYLAQDTQLDREVALKIPKVGLTDQGEFLVRFKREAQSAAKLSHPGICSVFDFGEHEGSPYITMAYIDGEPLSRFVGRKQVDNPWIVNIVGKIAQALAHAHEAGVVHRDLKSANVLIDRDGNPIVTDFGLAARVDQDDETRITQIGAIIGTPAYMSPEQIEGDSNVIGPPADIYALGVILYELLAGELPFRGSMGSLIAQITRDKPKSPVLRNPDADPTLAAYCLKLLSKRTSQRPASMAEVASDLAALKLGKQPPTPDDDQSQEKRAKLEAAKTRVAELVKRGQFAKAVAVLEKIVAIKDPEAAEHAAWARSEIKRIKAMPKKLRDGAPHLVAAAKKLLAKHDYGQAAQLLQQVPSDMRSPEAAQLLHQAIELQDEADLLLTDLHDCVDTKTYDGIEDNVIRLLELKPGNKFARELWEALETYQKVPRAQRNYRFDNSGNLQPREEGLSKGLLAGIGVAVVAFGAMAFAMKGYLANPSDEAGKITVADNDQSNAESGPSSTAPSQPPQAELPEVATSTTQEWNSLFNGRDFTGWREYGGGSVGEGWDVNNGELQITGRGNGLVTTSTYDNFELEFEWATSDAGGDTGLFYRVSENRNSINFDGLEYQIFDNPESSVWNDPTRRSGALFGISGQALAIKPRGEFNTSRIIANGERLEHWLNGVKVCEATIGDAVWDAALSDRDRQKFRDYPLAVTGHIGIQSFGNPTRFRNIRIRELTPSPAPAVAATQWTNLFNGRDFTGWQYYKGGQVSNGWEVRNGELHITPSPREAVRTYPYDIITTDTYDNFELEFEWKAPQPANSGVMYRVTQNGKPPFETGIEYQVLDDPASNDTASDIRKAGSIYSLFGKPISLKPRDQFNKSRIIANGDHIEHWLNDQLVVETDIGSSEWNRAVRNGKAAQWPNFMKSHRGHICLQNKGQVVHYRNIRIRSQPQ